MKIIILLVLIYTLAFDFIVCFDCPADGLYADPSDEHYYYNCGAGRAYRVKCQTGLVYNSDIQECDYTIGTGGPNSTTPIAVSPTNTVVVTTTNPVTVPVTVPVVTTAPPVVTTAAPIVTTAAPVVTTPEPQITTIPPEVTATPPTTAIPTTSPPPTVVITTNTPTTEAATTTPPTTVQITTAPPTAPPTTVLTTEATTAKPVEPSPTVAVTTAAPVVTTVTPDPLWEENKAKIVAELARMETYMKAILRDSGVLIKEGRYESMQLMVESIKAEIAKIDAFEIVIADELKKVTKISDKFFLDSSAKTLQLDKEQLNTLLTDLLNALASTIQPQIDPHGNP